MCNVCAHSAPEIADLAKIISLILVREKVDEVFWAILRLHGEAIEEPQVRELEPWGHAHSLAGEGEGVSSLHLL